VAEATVEEWACAPGGYEELECLLDINQRRGQRGPLTFPQFDCPVIWFAWFIEILRMHISKRCRSSKAYVGEDFRSGIDCCETS
jgi:hypothetical protein